MNILKILQKKILKKFVSFFFINKMVPDFRTEQMHDAEFCVIMAY